MPVSIQVPDGYVESQDAIKQGYPEAARLHKERTAPTTKNILCSWKLGFGNQMSDHEKLQGGSTRPMVPPGGCVRPNGAPRTQHSSEFNMSTTDDETSDDEQTKADISNALAQQATTPVYIRDIRDRLRKAPKAMKSDSPSSKRGNIRKIPVLSQELPIQPVLEYDGGEYHPEDRGTSDSTGMGYTTAEDSRRLADLNAPNGLFAFVPILMILMLVYVILRKSAQKWNSIRSSQTDLPATRERSTRWCD